MNDQLIPRLTEVLVAAQRRYRTQRGWGALTSIPIPNGLIDEVAAGIAPVLRELVREAVKAEMQTIERVRTMASETLRLCRESGVPESAAHLSPQAVLAVLDGETS